MIIECRCHTGAALNQESVVALAYRTNDTGASGGNIVSPFGLQAGEKKVAAGSQIVEIKLAPAQDKDGRGARRLRKPAAGFGDENPGLRPPRGPGQER